MPLGLVNSFYPLVLKWMCSMAFIVTLLTQALLGILPGFLLLRVLRFSRPLSFLFALPASMCFLSIVATILPAFKIFGPLPLLAVSALCLISLYLYRHFVDARKKESGSFDEVSLSCEAKTPSFGALALGVALACLLMTLMYFKPIGQSDSFIQFDDNVTHLAIIESNSQTGNYSPIFSAYNLPDDPNGKSTGSYYPSGFHLLPALACSILGCNAAVAENSSILLLCCLAFPIGLELLVFEVSGRNKLAAYAAAPLSFASVAFPFRMLAVHGPFPNIAGFALSTLFVAAFIFSWNYRSWPVGKRCLFVLFPMLALFFVHPNALIFGFVFVFPFFLCAVLPRVADYLCKRIRVLKSHYFSTLLVLRVLSVVFSLFVWLFVHNLSFMQAIVNFIWEWSPSLVDAIRAIANGGLLLGIPQYFFAVLSLLGVLSVVRRRDSRWLALTFAEFSLIYVLTGVGDNTVKSLVSGFWYTDPERLSAMVAISMLPLASFGLLAVAGLLSRITQLVINKVSSISARSQYRVKLFVVLSVAFVFILVNYRPLFGYLGMPANTAWAQNYYDLYHHTLKQSPNPYTEEERAFIWRIKPIVGDDLVINQPYDGSAFAYSVDGLNLYYPYRTGVGESKTSWIIRTSLNKYSCDPKVKSAVKSIDAKWVLQLSQDEFGLSGDGTYMNSICMGYFVDDWKGFIGIDPSTEGFELVVEEGPFRLYRIKD